MLEKVEEDMVGEGDLGVILYSIKRTLQGTKLYVKSQEIETFFKGLATHGAPPLLVEKWKGVSLYPLPPEVLGEHLVLESCILDAPDGKLLHNGVANLTFLRHIGLGKGVSFIVGTMPCRRTYLEEYCEGFRRGFRELYNNYIRPFEVETLVTKEKRRD